MKHILVKTGAFIGLLILCTWLALKVGNALSTYMYSANQSLTF